jgi:hypothetical protein
VFEFESGEEFESIKRHLEDLMKDIGAEENGAVLVHVLKSYLARWQWMAKKYNKPPRSTASLPV